MQVQFFLLQLPAVWVQLAAEIILYWSAWLVPAAIIVLVVISVVVIIVAAVVVFSTTETIRPKMLTNRPQVPVTDHVVVG